MHHDDSGNAVEGCSPLNIDSFDVNQTILLRVTDTFDTSWRGRSTI